VSHPHSTIVTFTCTNLHIPGLSDQQLSCWAKVSYIFLTLALGLIPFSKMSCIVINTVVHRQVIGKCMTQMIVSNYKFFLT